MSAGCSAGPDVVDGVAAAIEIMEQQHAHGLKGLQEPAAELKALIFPPGGGASKIPLVNAPPMPGAARCLALIEAAEMKMTAAARAGWRWRLIRLRAQIDADIQQTQGFHDAASDRLYREVEEISCAQRGVGAVAPPTRQMLIRCFVDSQPGPM